MRPCGLTAMSHCGSRFARLASTAALGHACGLRFGLFCRGKTIPPLRPPACPAPPLACSCRANLASKYTHMSMEAYPPDGPQISPPQGSQNFSARVGCVGRSALCARVRLLPSPCLENFCAQQAGGCAVPDPDRFGEPEIGHAPTITWWSSNSNIWR